MVKSVNPISALLFLAAVFLSAAAQVFLKKAALRQHQSLLREYLNWRVAVGYMIMLGCTAITVIAYRGIPLSIGMIMETTSYIYIMAFGALVFKERVSGKKIVALGLIICGIILYAT